MKLEVTTKGIAAMWLRGNCPDAGMDEVESLAKLFEGLMTDALRQGINKSIGVMDESPTMSAAKATLEEDIKDIEREILKQKEDELDIDVTRL